MKMITDQYGRTFKSLRVSLLNRCNLGCVYCSVGKEDPNSERTGDTEMRAPTLLTILARLHSKLQLETIRLTGGEPLLYPELIPVIEGIKSLGINNIKLTTNGFLLERLAPALKRAGMESINVSLDAVDEDVYFLMSRRNNVQRIMAGIERAQEVGLQVKINAVLMKGINEFQILPLLEYAFSRSIPIRFLEVMAMGHLHNQSKDFLFTQDEILQAIATKYNFYPMARGFSATANYWQTQEGNSFGIIANESQPFCHDCNRLRLDSNGNIYGCLSSNHPISISGITKDLELEQKLIEAISQKQVVRFTGSELSMLHIGG